ncbi:type II toxin-antitoxin system HipA family toxin [soil metagenome]
MARTLALWMHGHHVATITRASADGREIHLSYTGAALELAPQNTPLLSCSLPLRRRGSDATPFLAGLLPEGHALRAMADLAEVATVDTFGLLARFGRDVAGAVVIAEVDVDPADRSPELEPYGPGDLDAAVAELPERPLDLHDDSELSLPGLQDKLLLVDTHDGWARPRNGHASTHILKADDARHPGLVDAEAACLRIARTIGLTAVDVTVETIADQRCLIVSRFDRTAGPDGPARVHQEDLCQATGTDLRANRGRGKYSSAGGPDLEDAARLLDRYSTDPLDQLARLVQAVTFTVAIGNADAHGKNVAFVHPSPGEIELAPLYDTVPTVLWPALRRDPAMPIGPRVCPIDKVTGRDVVAAARLWHVDPDRAAPLVTDCADAIAAAAHEAYTPDVPNTLEGSVLAACERLSQL